MTNHLTAIRNNSKIASLDISTMENALQFSKEDINLFFYRLAVVADKHSVNDIRNQAWKYLSKQDKLQNILNDLITRLEILKINLMDGSGKERILELSPLRKEIEIFNEIHFQVKRTYLRFINEHFQEGLGQAFMVA